MTTKSDFLLAEALSISPAERARIAHCLISSLDEPGELTVTQLTILSISKQQLESPLDLII